MPIKWIVRLMPDAVKRPGHRPRRLSLAAGLAAVATLTACLAAGSASAAPGRPARAGMAGGAGGAAVIQPLACGPPDFFIQCYSPGQYQVAYGVAPLLRSGITGKGETVVMPELAHIPGPNLTDIRKDLAAFDRKFGLPAAKLKVTTALAGASAPYVAGTEEVEDTEIVHTIAPGAILGVVLVPANAVASAANFAAAVTGVIHAAIAQHAAVVSVSGSEGEHLFTPAEVARIHAALQQAAGRHLTVVASSGDTGVISDDGPPSRSACPPPTRWCWVLAAPPWAPASPPAPTTARWPGTPTPVPPPAATALCSAGPPTRTAPRASAECAASPTSPPTPTPPPP